MKQLFLLVFLLTTVRVAAQLPNGSTAPDFTLTDYYGGTHNLYSYLDAGKTVFVEIFAAHCPTCWAYHQTHRLKNIYEAHGPDATDELMVFALEYDEYNDSTAFLGNHEPWVTQGNWLEGTPYPIFNVELPDRGVFADYNVTFYPVIYKICPDRILERVQTSWNETQLYQLVQDCQAALSVNELIDLGDIRFDPLTRSLLIEHFADVQGLEVYDTQGRVVQRVDAINASTVQVAEVPLGVYLFRLITDRGPVVKRFVVE